MTAKSSLTPNLPGDINAKPPLISVTFLTFLSISFFVFFGLDMLLPTLSLYLDSKSCSKEEIGLIFSSFTVSAVLSRIMATRLSWRFGATRVYRFGLFIGFLAILLFFVFPHKLVYLLARLTHGAGAGLTSTLMISMAAQTLPPQRLAEGLGYLGLGSTVALALGPLAGLWLANNLGYEIMFMSVSSCYAVGLLISLILPNIKLASDLKPIPKGLGSFWEPKAIPAGLITILFGCMTCAVSAYLAIYFQEYNLPSAAGFFVVSTIGTCLARVTTGRIFDRFGHFFVIPPAAGVMALTLLALIFMPHPPYMYFIAVIYGLAMGSLFPSFQVLTLSSAPAERRTVATAVFFNGFDIGMGFGTFIMGLLAGYFQTYLAVFPAALVFLLAMLIYYFWHYLSQKK
ncbi:MAG: MFS transporter [Deltaproteobacteria bacterium]|jgi:MFS family permease|nr:MFS transporter [Deltaproteobacteria bacterium]